MRFEYYRFLDELGSIESEFVDNTPKVRLEDLCSDSMEKNPFPVVYPNQKDILSEYQHCTYYRIESARAAEYCGAIRTVMVFLVPFTEEEKFRNYYGIIPNKFSRYIINDTAKYPNILPMIGNIENYRDNDVKKIYEPIFRDIWEFGDKSRIPVYANRMENCLALEKEDVTWETFKNERIKDVNPQKPDEPVVIGNLKHGNPREYFGERIAWLELLGFSDPAKDIKDMAAKDQDLAEDLAFMFHDLISAPIFYCRKTLKTMCFEFDFNVYEHAISEFICKKKPTDVKLLKRTKKEFCNIYNMAKRIIVEQNDLDCPPSSKMPTAIDKKSGDSFIIQDIIENEGLGMYRDKCNEDIPDYKYSLLDNSDEKETIRNKMIDFRNDLSDVYEHAFLQKKELKLDVTGVALSIGAGLVLSGIAGPLAGIITVPLELAGLAIGRYVKDECQGRWMNEYREEYSYFKYIPTIYVWQLGVKDPIEVPGFDWKPKRIL